MKILIYLSISLLFLTLTVSAQTDSSEKANMKYPVRKLTIEPAIGMEPISDLIISSLIHLNVKKRLCLVSHTSYAYNNLFQRKFNYIKTNYNYTLCQKFGIGTTLYAKHSSHAFSFMAGIRYDSYEETLENPEFEKVTVSVSSVSPDVGLLYNVKAGKKKYFFSFRMYIPLYPYPFKTSDIFSLSDNFANLLLEFGVGIRLN